MLEGNGDRIRWYITANNTNYTSPILVEACLDEVCVNDTSTLSIGSIVIEPEAPTQIIDFPALLELNQSDYKSFNLGGYFTNYAGVTIYYEDSISNTTLSNYTIIGGSQKTIVTDDITISFRTLSSNILLEITTKTTDFSNIIYINASNAYGEASDGFLIRVSTTEVNETALQTWFGSVEDIFPDADELTLGQQMLYVILFMLITAVVLGIGAYVVEEQLIRNMLLLGIGLLLICELFFFIAISYIPITIVVMGSLLASFIIYVIFRKATA